MSEQPAVFDTAAAAASVPVWLLRLQAAWTARGALARALWPLAALFGALTGLRRALYRQGWMPVVSLPVPVIVVGNLIVGGAGKTPVVIAVVDCLRRRGYTPGIVSRGHGRRSTGVLEVQRDTPVAASGDEPLLLHLRTRAPVVVGKDRAAAARALLEMHPQVNIIVGDDGLQHLRLGRDVQVLVFDERGAGNGWLLPAGPMRELPPARLPERNLVVYNAPAASTHLPGTLALRSLSGLVSLADWWQGMPASAALLATLRDRPMLAAAGVAQPQRFFEMLRAGGLQITPLPLSDHHAFASLPWPPDTLDVVVTEKDAIKLEVGRIGRTRVWVAPLDFTLDAAFDAALIALLPPPGTPDGNAPA